MSVKFAEDAVFCVTAVFFSFSQSGTSVFWWCHTLWQLLAIRLDCLFFLFVCVFSCLADMMFLPPPPNPPSKSLSRKFVMYAFVQFTRKRNENTCQSDFEKSFFFPLPAEERTSLWQKRVKKAWEKQPRDGWWGAGNYRQHTRHCTERISHIHTHTHTHQYMHICWRHWQCEIIWSFFFWGYILAKIQLSPPC